MPETAFLAASTLSGYISHVPYQQFIAARVDGGPIEEGQVVRILFGPQGFYCDLGQLRPCGIARDSGTHGEHITVVTGGLAWARAGDSSLGPQAVRSTDFAVVSAGDPVDLQTYVGDAVYYDANTQRKLVHIRAV